MTEVLLPGLVELQQRLIESMPPISEDYPQALGGLVLSQNHGVTLFRGGPLSLESGREVWMSPVEVDDGQRYSYFQLFCTNTRPEDIMGVNSVPVTRLDIDETSYKLTPQSNPIYQKLMDCFGDEAPHVFIRPCNTGLAYFPRIIVPRDDPKLTDKHVELLLSSLELPQEQMNWRLSGPYKDRQTFNGLDELDGFTHARTYNYGANKVYSYGFILENDPWGYYEVFTTRPLEYMLETSVGEDIEVRVDSGCDTGQLFGDKGCDCSEQLHRALSAMQQEPNNNGIVIHIPTQDGRGYGTATKMETELLKIGARRIRGKRRLEVVPDLHTIDAARQLLGADFDIRDYSGAGKLLRLMGVEKIRFRTENVKKLEDISASGIEITQVATETTGENGCAHHVKAKHEHSNYRQVGAS